MKMFILFILQTLMLTQAWLATILFDNDGWWSALHEITDKNTLISLLNAELKEKVEFSEKLTSEEVCLVKDATVKVQDIVITGTKIEVSFETPNSLGKRLRDALRENFRDRILKLEADIRNRLLTEDESKKKLSESHSKDEVSDEESYDYSSFSDEEDDEESENETDPPENLQKTERLHQMKKNNTKSDVAEGPIPGTEKDGSEKDEKVEKQKIEENEQKLTELKDNQIPPITGTETEDEKVEKQKLEENEQKSKLNDNQIPPIPTAKTTERKSIPVWGWVCITLSIVLFLISIAGCCGYLDDCCCCGVQELNFDDDHTHVKEQYIEYKDVSHQALPRDLNIDVDHEKFGTLSSLFNDDDLQKAQDDICGIRNMQNELRTFDVEDSAQNDAEESATVHAEEPKPTSQLDDILAQKMGKEKNEKSSLETQQNLDNIE